MKEAFNFFIKEPNQIHEKFASMATPSSSAVLDGGEQEPRLPASASMLRGGRAARVDCDPFGAKEHQERVQGNAPDVLAGWQRGVSVVALDRAPGARACVGGGVTS